MSSHVVVFYKSVACGHCTQLSNIWDKAPSKDDLSVTASIRKVYPSIRFAVVTAKDNTGFFDDNTAPRDLIRYGSWFPMILLVPGWLWDKAMEKLGPKNPVELTTGVIPLNGKFVNGKLTYDQKYNITKPSEFARWMQEVMVSDEYKKYQTGPTPFAAPIIAPVVAPIIAPVIAPVVAPVVQQHGHTHQPHHQVGGDRDTAVVNNVIAGGNGGNVCGMRIIQRPK